MGSSTEWGRKIQAKYVLLVALTTLLMFVEPQDGWGARTMTFNILRTRGASIPYFVGFFHMTRVLRKVYGATFYPIC